MPADFTWLRSPVTESLPLLYSIAICPSLDSSALSPANSAGRADNGVMGVMRRTLEGETAIRDADTSAHGFSGSRHASTGAGPDQVTGHIRLGRVHLARYKSDNLVERSCAINTMAHEISHTLSERKTEFRMHILDSGPENRPPDGIIEASYLIGSAAQCSYLEIHGRIRSDALLSCFQTFSDPTKASRFRSLACDDFSNQDLIRP